MPKKRNSEHKNLPKGWRWKNGAYRYRVPKGQGELWDNKTEVRLGKTLSEAYKTWSERIDYLENVTNVKELIERYLCEVAPQKAAKTYEENKRQSKNIIMAFGHMQLSSIRPTFIYQYIDKRSAKVAANREVKLLSHALTKAVEWGYIDKHPFKGEVRLKNAPSRARYVTDEEYNALLAVEGYEIMKLFTEFTVLTGLRKGDALSVKRQNLKKDGLHVHISKTNKQIIIEWSDDLKSCVDRIIAARSIHITPWLFCKENGDSYYKDFKSSGFDTMWRRFREKAGIKDITMHDLRAKAASDFEDEQGAQKLLAHDNSSMTKSYRRKPESVKPLR